MATVYEATMRDIGKRVALKILHSDLARQPEMTSRFINEARSASQVAHPSLISIFDCGRTDEGFLFLAMELLEGICLEKYIQQRERLSSEDSIAIGRQIASALDAVHAHGVIHRDLKPGNVFLVEDSESHQGRRVKVLDFGIAKLAQSLERENQVMTKVGAVMGTPVYMAPEQWRDLPSITAKADVYSLGIILYEMLAGTTPFSGSNYQLMHDHFHRKPPAPIDVAPWVPQRLSDLILRMLKKDPSDRPTMSEIRDALQGQAPEKVPEQPPIRSSYREPKPRPVALGYESTAPLLRPLQAPESKAPESAPVLPGRDPNRAERRSVREASETLEQYEFLRPILATLQALDGSSLEELFARWQASALGSFSQYLVSAGIVTPATARMITAVQKGYVQVDLKALAAESQKIRGPQRERTGAPAGDAQASPPVAHPAKGQPALRRA